MINQNGLNVPDNTIAVIYDDTMSGINFERIAQSLKKPDRKRDWFEPFFYNCLPLIIGNQYGFVLTANYGFNIVWNGGNKKEDIQITYIVPSDIKHATLHTVSHFGYGTISFALPIVLRTPPGINLMTINPPNHIIKNATVLTGVVESDHIRAPFTFNLKIHEPNVLTSFPAGTPLSGFIPIPRMFADQFELKDAEEIFGEAVFNEELEMYRLHELRRGLQLEDIDPSLHKPDRHYFDGEDILGNKFPEHQTPSGKIVKSTISQQDTLPL